jgi:large subunit ribosomal protein L35
MAYKLKPNKAVLKRFKVTKTGKLKRHHSKTSHLMSARTPAKKRELRGTEILAEGFAKNMRRLIGKSHLNPARTAHKRALAAKKAAVAAAAK